MKKEYDLGKMRKREANVKTSPGAAKVQISLRLDGGDLARLRTEAERFGIPYQTLLGSLVHQYVNGDLIPRKTVDLLKKLHVA